MLYEDNTNAHSIGWSTFHLQWCTKYRYKIFRKQKLKNLCLIALLESAKRYKIEIEEIDIGEDHLHMIVKLPLTMSVSKALNLLIGFSSRLIFGLCPKLRLRYPRGHWTKGKFAGSVGHITLDVAKEYVRNQEAHHANTYLANNWNPHPLWCERMSISVVRYYRTSHFLLLLIFF